MGTLYLIPVTLGESGINAVMPPKNREIILSLSHFIVENIRSARRFLKATDKTINIDGLHFHELNEHSDHKQVASYIELLKTGTPAGLMSEAGCPGIADPGADMVRVAHEQGIRVIPLTGPSSILLALMASGMNGQNFAFNGYLPVRNNERVKYIKLLEKKVYDDNQTQMFIETPYRNTQMLDDVLRHCLGRTRLCIACDLTLETEFIKTMTVNEWQEQVPDVRKRPAIFILGC